MHHSQFDDHDHDHLWCETALDHNGRIEALSHVEHQQHWMIRENTSSTDVSLRKIFKHLDYGIQRHGQHTEHRISFHVDVIGFLQVHPLVTNM